MYSVHMNYFIFFRITELESLGYLGRSVNKQNIHSMVERLAYSDWLILYYLAQVSQLPSIFFNVGTKTSCRSKLELVIIENIISLKT